MINLIIFIHLILSEANVWLSKAALSSTAQAMPDYRPLICVGLCVVLLLLFKFKLTNIPLELTITHVNNWKKKTKVDETRRENKFFKPAWLKSYIYLGQGVLVRVPGKPCSQHIRPSHSGTHTPTESRTVSEQRCQFTEEQDMTRKIIESCSIM